MLVPYKAENDPYFKKRIKKEKERREIVIFLLALVVIISLGVMLAPYLRRF